MCNIDSRRIGRKPVFTYAISVLIIGGFGEFGEYNLRCRGPASPDTYYDVYMTASFAAVRKPKHRNFQILARKPSQMQFVGCQNPVKPNAFCLGIVAGATDS